MASARPAVRPARIDTVAPMTPSAWLRYDVIERMLPAGVSDVLEIGCGQGALAARLSQRFRYLGIEPDKASWTIAARRLGAVGAGEARNISFDRLDGDQKFDLVCAFEVLEHIEDDTAAVKEWSARLREHGWLMLSVPAYQDRYGAADELVGHFRRYDPEAITGLLAGCGFRLVGDRPVPPVAGVTGSGHLHGIIEVGVGDIPERPDRFAGRWVDRPIGHDAHSPLVPGARARLTGSFSAWE